MSNAEKKVAIVTGGSRGIGRAVVVELARQGWNVAFNYLSNKEAADATLAAVKAAGGHAIAVQGDVAKGEDIDKLFAATMKEFGRLDSLINNAGVVGGVRSILDADDAHLTAFFRTNVTARSCVPARPRA